MKIKQFFKEHMALIPFLVIYFITGVLYGVSGNYSSMFLILCVCFLLPLAFYSQWSHGETLKLLVNRHKDYTGFSSTVDDLLESYDQMVLAVRPDDKLAVLNMQNAIKAARIMRVESRREWEKKV
jgi:hypothetical protein